MLKISDYLKITEAAAFLGVTVPTLRNWDKLGILVPVRLRINRYRLYRKEDLEDFLNKINNCQNID